jgi:hypothetical protein
MKVTCQRIAVSGKGLFLTMPYLHEKIVTAGPGSTPVKVPGFGNGR